MISIASPLRDLLTRQGVEGVVRIPLDRRASLKDVIESLGIPHPEIGSVRVDGRPAHLAELARDGTSLEVRGHDRPIRLRIGGADGAGDGAPGSFLLDVHLGKLARLLRLLGVDTSYSNDCPDERLARLAEAENRILLTRDRALLKRGSIRHGLLVRSNHPGTQVREVLARFDLTEVARPWSRCLRCNAALESVEASEVWDRLEPRTKLYYRRFRRCSGCSRIYWEGSHFQRLREELSSTGLVDTVSRPSAEGDLPARP